MDERIRVSSVLKRKYMSKKQNNYNKLKNNLTKQVTEKIPTFNLKSFAHFDRPFSFGRYITKDNTTAKTKFIITPASQKKIKQQIDSLHLFLNSPEKIAKHAFYPFIAFDIKERRSNLINKIKYYERKQLELSGIEKDKCIEALDNLKKKGIIKKRPIRYASHIDGYIYAHYASLLSEKYEKRIQELDLGDVILAYRKLPPVKINDKEICPNNCTMARDVFEEIKKRGNNCYALAFDIHSFYDYIDHKNLYKEWAQVLGVDKLPEDHLNIYKSLTKYCYIDLKEVCYYVNKDKKKPCLQVDCVKCNKKIYKKIPKILFKNAEKFRIFKDWYKNFYKDTEHKKFHKNEGFYMPEPYGIPQGSAMSALLSNIYMIPFDSAMKNLAEDVGGLYRRYCDDIMFICPHDGKIKEKIINKIKECISERGENLKIHPIEEWDNYSKSQCYDFTAITKIKQHPLQYLGFYFDGEKVRIREGSLARYLRKSKRAVTAMKFNAIKKLINMHKQKIPIQEKQKKLYRHHLYEQYTHLGKRNFISYAYRTFDTIFDTSVIKQQINSHQKRLNKLIEKADVEILKTFNNINSL